MILAVADYADRAAEPPPALRYEFDARHYGALPNAGGLRDQPARLMADMRLCGNVYDALQTVNRAKTSTGGAWANLPRQHPTAYRIWSTVLQMRQENHGTE